MDCKLFLLFVAILCAVEGTSVIVGQIEDPSGIVRKVFEHQYEASAIPFLKRKQEVNFEYPVGDQEIKGIAVRDMENGPAEASITRGGVGLNFVNIELKSARGSGFEYLIQIYA